MLVSSIVLMAVALLISPVLFVRSQTVGSTRSVTPGQFVFLSGILAVSAAVFAALLGMQSALLGCALTLGVLSSVADPVAAVSFFIAVLFLRPWESLPDAPLLLVLPRGLALLSIVSWALHAVRSSRVTLAWTKSCSAAALMIAWLAISALPSGIENIALLASSFFPIAVIALLIVNLTKTRHDLALVKRSIELSLVGVITQAIIHTIALDPEAALQTAEGEAMFQRLNGVGIWGNSNELAALIVISLPLVAATLVRQRETKVARILHAAALLILLVGLWYTQSRAALVAVGGSLAMWSVASGRLSARSLALIAAALVVPLVLMATIKRDAEDLTASSSSRVNYLIAGLRMVRSNPLIGVGFDNYPKRYEQFTPAFEEWGERTAHSSWVLVMAEAGIPGLVLMIILAYHTVKSAWAMRREAPEYLLALTGYSVMFSTLSHAYLFLPYVLFFLITAAERVYRTCPGEHARVRFPSCGIHRVAGASPP